MYGIKWYRQAGVRMYLIEIVTSVNSQQSSQLPYNSEYRTPPEPGSYQSSPDSHQGSYQTSTRVSFCRQSLFELIQQRTPTKVSCAVL